MDTPDTRRPGEAVFASLMLVVSLILFWQAYRIAGFSSKSSPGAFPLTATGVMIVASVAVLARVLRQPAGTGGFAAFRALAIPNVVLAFGALIVLYGLVLESLGFILASFGFLFSGILLLYRRGPLPALGYAVVSIVLIYVIFRLVFQVVLPEGIVPERRILADFGALLGRMTGR
jgi:hypothetical protein